MKQRGKNSSDLYDLHGNMWEWCFDAYGEEAYRCRIDGDADPGALERASTGSSEVTDDRIRVLRGGSYGNTAGDCRSAFRYRFRAVSRGRRFGFRVCLPPGPADSQQEKTGRAGAVATRDEGRGTRSRRRWRGRNLGRPSSRSETAETFQPKPIPTQTMSNNDKTATGPRLFNRPAGAFTWPDAPAPEVLKVIVGEGEIWG